MNVNTNTLNFNRVIMSEDDIKIKSGTIWILLSNKGKLSIKEIEEQTDCGNLLLHLALGWLAREDKIYFTHIDNVLYAELTCRRSELFY